MEPRPQRPSRATGPYISTGTPSPPSAGATNAGAGYGTGAFDASSAPPAPPPAIGYDPDYSPGQPLTPLRGPRGANIVGPLLAVAALAIIVAAVAFIVSQFRNGGDDNGAQPTAVVAINASPTTETDQQDEDATKPAGADNADAPTRTADDSADEEPAQEPKVNRDTEPGDELDSSSEDQSTDSGDEAPAERTRARQWLPTTRVIGSGYEQTDNGTRDETEVANSFPDPADAGEKIVAFGWQENVYREYSLPNGAPEDTIVISVSVHRFDTEAGAKDALQYFADGGQTAQGLAVAEDAPEFGEDTISLQGAIEGGNVYVIYIRQNNFVIRLGGLSPTGDPAEFTNGVAERIMER